MKNLSMGALLALLSFPAIASNSSLDRSFSVDGFLLPVFDAVPAGRDYAQAIAQQPSGNYVVAGEIQTATPTGRSIGIVRINRATGGEISRAVFNGNISNVRGVASDALGFTVVVGSTPTNLDGAADLAVWRFNGLNNPDAGFSGDGGYVYDLSNQTSAADNPLAVVVRPSRQILVLVEELRAGQAVAAFAVVAISADGSAAFERTLGVSGFNGGAMVLDSDGRLLVAVNQAIGGCTRAVVIRFQAGSLASFDPTFGVSGTSTLASPLGNPNNCTPTVTSIALDASGRVLLGGHIAGLAEAQSWAARLSANGAQDPSFNVDGWAAVPRPISGLYQYTFGVGAELDGKVVLGGTFVFSNASIGQRPILARLLANGQPDSSFNPFVATQTYALTSSTDQAGVAMIMDGERAVLVGAVGFGSLGDYDFAVMRNQGPLFQDGFE